MPAQIERSVVLEEMGRALLPAPYLSSVLAADVLLALDDESARAELLPAIAAGELLATVAIAEEASRWARPHSAPPRRGGLRLAPVRTARTGARRCRSAGMLLVLANSRRASVSSGWRQRGRPDRDAVGQLRPDSPLRPNRLRGHTRCRAGQCGTRWPRWTKVTDLAALALAAESVGAMAHSLALAVDYAKVRVQFGRYIGSYQAVKHLCVDSYVDYELAYSVLRQAAWAADESPEFPLAAAHARVSVLPAAFGVAARTVQVHGGIGYTWEHDAHLYYKRTKANELFLGGDVAAHAVLADRLGI